MLGVPKDADEAAVKKAYRSVIMAGMPCVSMRKLMICRDQH